MSLIDGLIVLAVAGLAVAAFLSLKKQKKNGGCCGSCAGCAGCGSCGIDPGRGTDLNKSTGPNMGAGPGKKEETPCR